MIATWRRLPWGLLGMLVLVASVERYFARYEINFRRPENLDWLSAGRSARQKTRGREYLVLGTSMTQQGVAPIVLRDRTGGEAFNLSICAGQPPSTYFLLKRALDSGAKPKAVLVDFHPHYLSGSYRTALAFWPHLLEPAEALDLAWTARDPTFFASTAVAHALPSVSGRLTIRQTVSMALSGETNLLPLQNLAFLHNKNQNFGGILYPKNPKFQGDVATAFVQAFLPNSWSVDPVNALYVHRFMALAESRGVVVYWLIPPLSPELQKRRDRAGLDEPYDRFVRSVQAEHANLVVLDARRSGFRVDVFTDAAHLDCQGARALTAAVGDTVASLADGRPGSRSWIELPPYRDRPSASPLIDLQDSAVALQTLFKRTR